MKKIYIVLISLFCFNIFDINVLAVEDINNSNRIENNRSTNVKKKVNKNNKKVITSKKNRRVNSKKVVNNSVNSTSKVKNNKPVLEKKQESVKVETVKVEKTSNNELNSQNLISPKAVVVKPVVGSEDSKVKNKSLDVKKEQSSKQSRFYGKANINIGYGYQDGVGGVVNAAYYENPDNITYQKQEEKGKNSFVISGGYNVYLKTGNTINPFVGYSVLARFSSPSSYYNEIKEGSTARANGVEFKEYGTITGRVGVMINLYKNILSLQPYVLGGINMANIGQRRAKFGGNKYDIKTNRVNFGVVYGAGLDFVIGERFTIGGEFYRSVNKTEETYGYNFIMVQVAKERIKMNNFLIKLGYLF